jgi:kinetochore protein Mis12/MTW1
LHKLETLLESTVDKNFDKFEIYVLRSVLSVPEELATWVRLRHYDNLTYPIPTNAPSPDAIQLLRRKVAASRKVSQALVTEQARNSAMLEQLKGMTSSVADAQAKANSSFAFLADTPSASIFNVSAKGQQTLTTNTKFALSQLPALRAILTELRPKLAELQKAGLGHSGAREDMKAERKAYIDHRTMEHADRNGHASSGTAGFIAGRDIDEAEVQAMEKVATIFGPS